MNTTLIVLVLAAAAVAAFLFFRKKPAASDEAESTVESTAASSARTSVQGEPSPEMKERFDMGMDPAADGVTVMYALETCRHCRRTREFLDENNIHYHNIYVDQFSGDRRAALMDKVRSFNPRGSFPTVILPNGKVVVGYREQLLREALIHDTERTS